MAGYYGFASKADYEAYYSSPAHFVESAAMEAYAEECRTEEVIDPRVCTCHPDDGRPWPCARQYASTECWAENAVTNIETDLADIQVGFATLRSETVTLSRQQAAALAEIYRRLIGAAKAASNHQSRIPVAVVPVNEAQAEVDCTTNAMWMHAIDTLHYAKKHPAKFTGNARADLLSAYKRLGDAIKIVEGE